MPLRLFAKFLGTGRSLRVFWRDFAPVMGVAYIFPSLFFVFYKKVGRAHLHIAPRWRTEKTYQTCDFDGTSKTVLRRNP